MEHPTTDILLEYLDGTLDPSVADDVHRHVAGCRDCARELELQRAIAQSFIGSAAVQAPAGLVEQSVTFARLAHFARRPVRKFEFSFGNVVFLLFLLTAIAISVAIVVGSGPASETGSANVIVHETASRVQAWNEALMHYVRVILEPFRLRSPGSAASIILIVLPVLIALMVIDRYVLRFLHRSR